MKTELLDVRNLKTCFSIEGEEVAAVDSVSFTVEAGKTLGIVGESGSGKSVTALSILRLVPSPPGRIKEGEILFEGEDLLLKSEEEMRHIRGNRISMIFQEPMTSLNPVHTIGSQISEALMLHQGLSKREALEKSEEMLNLCKVSLPHKRIHQYPHELSGGMRQRAMIAMALACNPRLLIADEPTTALDVTVQAQILELIVNLQRETGSAVLFITHDLGVISEVADHVAVMYCGRIVEYGEAEDILSTPRHPYTKALLGSLPSIGGAKKTLCPIRGTVPAPNEISSGCRFRPRCDESTAECGSEEPPLVDLGGRRVRCRKWVESKQTSSVRPRDLDAARGSFFATEYGSGCDTGGRRLSSRVPDLMLELKELRVYFRDKSGFPFSGGRYVRAVDGVSLALAERETLGLVGESGCGKSTLGRAIVRLVGAEKGSGLRYRNADVLGFSGKEIRSYRKKVQMIFQDPFGSLNPRMTLGDALEEVISVHEKVSAAERGRRVERLLDVVGLPKQYRSRYPHEFSGGQRQRVVIARALAVNPEFLVCDEPVSALDVSIQAQIINLLEDLQAQLGLAYLFISHDMAVVRHISTRVAVMYLGKIVEIATTDELFESPLHPYTRALLAAIPDVAAGRRKKRSLLEGDVPSPLDPPKGCRFHPRCPLAKERCALEEPLWAEKGVGHAVACHFA